MAKSQEINKQHVSDIPTKRFVKRSFVISQNNINKHCDCRDRHGIYHCPKFLNCSVSDRFAAVKKSKLCLNCLNDGHTVDACKSDFKCKYCSRKHNSLLCKQQINKEPVKMLNQSNKPFEKENEPKNILLSATANKSSKQRTAILGTLVAHVMDPHGNFKPVRGILDSGSTSNIITLDAVKMLNLKMEADDSVILGLGGVEQKSIGNVQFTLHAKPNLKKTFKVKVQASVVDHITSFCPSNKLPESIFEPYLNLSLSDPNFFQPAPVDMLLGVGVFMQSVGHQDSNMSGALQTRFGWMVMGEFPIESIPSGQAFFLQEQSMDGMMKSLFEEEETASLAMSPEDTFCEEHFQQTTKRDQEGRYIVQYPFKDFKAEPKNDKQVITKLFKIQEKRIQNQDVQEKANQFFREYQELGHMSLSSHNDGYYIPYHFIFKEASSSTKIRAVFNASHRGKNQPSLNEHLLPGPKLQKDLNDILLRFRLNEVAFICDIKMMYRQILVDEGQRKYQQVLWRPGEIILTYCLNTVTYGLTPSAWLSQRTLVQLIQDEGSKSPNPKYELASRVVLEDMYVDDVVTGASSIEEAKQLKEELVELLSKGHFPLRKWSSNSPELLEDLPSEHLEKNAYFGVSVLGIKWNPSEDFFSYSLEPFQGMMTKRNILSYISKLFDCMGLVSPVIFLAKYFLKLIWLSKVEWDEIVNKDVEGEWLKFCRSLVFIKELKIPRYIPVKGVKVSLVGFADASAKGCAANVYIVCEGERISSQLARSKTKLAPAKQTIPRLELCAAVLLCQLVTTVRLHLHTFKFQRITLFSDSTVVLSWLKQPAHKFKTYVGNRVSVVQENSKGCEWRYVESKLNPADIASRGCTPKILENNNLWWNGPPFLAEKYENWPKSHHIVSDEVEAEEVKKEVVLVSIQEDQPYLLQRAEKFSSFTKLVRTIAWVKRFIQALKQKTKVVGPLTADELKRSTNTICRLYQAHYYPIEVKQLTSNQQISSISKLANFTPFLDEDQVLRVGGRLQEANIPEYAKHQIIVHKNSHLAKLIILHYHQHYLHPGPTNLISLMRQKFWIPASNSMVKKIVRSCVTCLRTKGKPHQPLMGNHHSSRVNPSKPWAHTSLDFAGPFNIKSSNLRKAPIQKAYFCLFVCRAVKAIHVEIVSELSTEAFMASLRRFTSRRGLPEMLYSDCGSNFLGASNQIKDCISFLQAHNDDISSSAASLQIQWSFQPPYAPNWGGLHERAVRSMKQLLKKHIIQNLTFEELSTVATQCEAILNSRILTAINENNDQFDFLTPAHFVANGPLFAVPQTPIDEKLAIKSRWKLVQQQVQAIWKRWVTEYLNFITERTKWKRTTHNPQPNQIVYITDMCTNPLTYPIGIIQSIVKGKDGVVRAAWVRSNNKTIIRPINKLILFPVSDQQ